MAPPESDSRSKKTSDVATKKRKKGPKSKLNVSQSIEVSTGAMGPVNHDLNVLWDCDKCTNRVSKDSKGIECERCHKWFCLDCAALTEAVYDYFTQ